jgi:L-seryl-tRNA(Ser) seleniumtransferase
MYRALRIDKLILQSLQVTLRHVLTRNWQAIPVVRMISTSPDEIRRRAERVASQLVGISLQIREAESAIGGGSTPGQHLPTWVLELSVPDSTLFEQRLREAPVPVIARFEHEKVLLDLRTVDEGEEAALISSVRAAAG